MRTWPEVDGPAAYRKDAGTWCNLNWNVLYLCIGRGPVRRRNSDEEVQMMLQHRYDEMGVVLGRVPLPGSMYIYQEDEML